MSIDTNSTGTNIADSSSETRDKIPSEERAATVKKSTGSPSARSSKDSPVAPSRVRRWLAKVLPADRFKGLFSSLVVHGIIAIVLALWAFPIMDKSVIPILLTELDLSEELEEIDESTLQLFTEVTLNAVDSPTALSSTQKSATAPVAASSQPVFDENMLLEATSEQPSALPPELTSANALVPMTSSANQGKGRVVVDSYDHAFDRLTQEIIDMLEKGKVLVVWCFDESGSMKDDQKAIRDRLEKVYAELGLNEVASGGNLTTAVTSFGSDFHMHLEEPTDRLDLIQQSIDSITVDATGQEHMTLAIAHSIQHHVDYAKRQRRQMVLILVSDESGNPEDNNRYLEETIYLAERAGCRIYVLGRESVFGYPYAHIEWEHPQTYVVHQIPVDRGPESAVVEQLQTEGFSRRTDSHPSGFGPYEQSRMAWVTGGMFFMLPSVELDVVGLDKRQYRLEAMTEYMPDLRPRSEVMEEINDSQLRAGLVQLIYEMNPYNEQAAKIIDMRTHFSIKIPEFIQQVRTEQAKIAIYSNYLDRMRNALEEFWYLREKEENPRWQANADLMRAQLLVYRIRLFEYNAYLNAFMNDPKVVPYQKPPDLHLIEWRLIRRQEMISKDITTSEVERAKKLLGEVIEKHPDSPWAARAEKELAGGLGVELQSYYRRVPTGGGNSPLIPVPKL